MHEGRERVIIEDVRPGSVIHTREGGQGVIMGAQVGFVQIGWLYIPRGCNHYHLSAMHVRLEDFQYHLEHGWWIDPFGTPAYSPN